MDRVLVIIKDWILSKIDDLEYKEDQEKEYDGRIKLRKILKRYKKYMIW